MRQTFEDYRAKTIRGIKERKGTAKGLFKKSSDFAVNYFDHTEVVSLNSEISTSINTY